MKGGGKITIKDTIIAFALIGAGVFTSVQLDEPNITLIGLTTGIGYLMIKWYGWFK